MEHTASRDEEGRGDCPDSIPEMSTDVREWNLKRPGSTGVEDRKLISGSGSLQHGDRKHS